MEVTEKIYAINGPIVTVQGPTEFSMQELVHVGHSQLIGEVIRIDESKTTIQVYEETAGLKPGEPIVGSGSAMSVELGPGLLNNIFDGIERPLEEIAKQSGFYIQKGVNVHSLDRTKKWKVQPKVNLDDQVSGGDIIAEIPESAAITHKVMVPPEVVGQVVKIVEPGEYTIEDTLAEIRLFNGDIYPIKAYQKWPIRTPRPVAKRLESTTPLLTGQRIIDTVFPIAKGGTAAIPGGFGTGKTTMQHQIAKFADADVIVYIGCGERGNEMTEVLEDFSKLIDPRSQAPLMERTVLIANTSNMPVAAREASIYTGLTIAEYYRDMGYDVAIMADSTSRWAEALRELSGRLEEMPAEEGYPAYLASRIATFYERAGDMETLNHSSGSVSIIGAVSPQGGDFSEPVTQNTKRFVRCFWGLDANLAHARHYPAINWMNSYSQYVDDLSSWYNKNVSPEFVENRAEMMAILHEEDELNEIVKLIGSDILPDNQKLTLQTARVLRLGFLQQNTFHAIDQAIPMAKQAKMLDVILYLHHRMQQLVQWGMPMSYLSQSDIFNRLITMKFDIPNDDLKVFDDYYKAIDQFYDKAMQENG
ncbi:V-type ATP synthase subunit A [Aerococcus christensenii]|uniref:V-type ATP synthase alpha chain n=1 Tax=Aerococcus christensenii TaxID=87541 RepID=A0A109RC04_9LACT|nr:V-type ATP synthase subunit A [Aerococcus christensenii]AMB91898.1 ATP synthase subunit A [Aerococcus christensenii]KXB36032.1 ATP synthase [Aerococcus christensenii]MDK8234403.1 V-type ATP synthase subunit A [Aerococcus christensenii]PKY90963.1 V-type ATP synthase subunit A [Aerococcus christensenii]